MTLSEVKAEELAERIEYKNACIIGKILEGQLKPTDSEIIRRLQNGSKRSI